MLARIITAFTLLLVLNVLERLNVFSAIPGKVPLKMILYVVDYLIIGYDILKKAGKGILEPPGLRREFPDGGRNSGSVRA